jgi:hypothetical protein
MATLSEWIAQQREIVGRPAESYCRCPNADVEWHLEGCLGEAEADRQQRCMQAEHWVREAPAALARLDREGPDLLARAGSHPELALRTIRYLLDALLVTSTNVRESRMLDALEAVLRVHYDDGPSQGYFGDPAPYSYGRRAHCCSMCGTHGEYGVEWPCPTVRAIAAALGVEP